MRRLDGLESRSRILPDIQAILKWVGFAILFCSALAIAQDWQTPIVLTHGYGHGAPQMVVDSLHRIHMFVVRSRDPRPNGGQPNTVVYYKFDNWGRPLAEAVELLPDSHWTDYAPGVFMDRFDRIHVVWLRLFDSSPATSQLIYVRLSTEGEFLNEPLIFDGRLHQQGEIEPSIYNLTESLSGEIWAACGKHFFAVDINGNLVEPLQYATPPPTGGAMFLSSDPDGSVWGCSRTRGEGVDSILTIRYWPPPLMKETTAVRNTYGTAVHAFAIDGNGSFHYVIYSDDLGLYYRFDSRSGFVNDSTIIDSSPSGFPELNICLIGSDSLQYVWVESLPAYGLNRVCFTVDGNIGIGPQFVSHPNFAASDCNTVWRDGGYWIPGWVFGGEIACAMLHIPGANEPLAVSESPTEQASQSRLHVYPQPNLGTLYFNLPTSLKGETNLTIYNILGQQVFQTGLQAPPAVVQPRIQLPPGLSSGTYLLSLSTQTQFLGSRFVLIR